MIDTIAVSHHKMDPIRTDKLVVSETVEPDDLRRLLESLAREDCAHSWRNFGPGGTLEELLHWENERRPTILFFFHLKRGSEMRLVAASAVAKCLNRNIPNPGFCVLGRCYIMPEFRGRGFYRHVLNYRLQYCRTRFGNGLNAIHMGAVNDRISRVITNHGLSGWPQFIHLGEEKLGVAKEIRMVDAYLMFLPDYVCRMKAALAGPDAPPSVIALQDVLSEVESTSIRNLGMLVKQTFENEREHQWLEDRDTRVFEQLLRFCRSIPLVGFQ